MNAKRRAEGRGWMRCIHAPKFACARLCIIRGLTEAGAGLPQRCVESRREDRGASPMTGVGSPPRIDA
jgi:hypothetical protein